MADRRQGRAKQGSPRRRGIFGRVWGGTKWLAGGPVVAAAPQDIVQGARFIRRLAQRLGATRPSQSPLRLTEGGDIDMEATAMAYGLSSLDLERLFARRRQETARAAYLAFGLGWLFFLAWLYRAATMPWTASRVVAVIEFLPFCILFFLAAFRAALENFRLRTRRMVTAAEYLLTSESFWPR